MEGYKAIIKFNTSEELNRVIENLHKQKMNNNFFFMSFGKMFKCGLNWACAFELSNIFFYFVSL